MLVGVCVCVRSTCVLDVQMNALVIRAVEAVKPCLTAPGLWRPLCVCIRPQR